MYQVLCRPIGDQRADAEQYRYDLERSLVTPADRLLGFVFLRPEETLDIADLSPSYRDRLVDLETRDLRRTFCLAARAVAFADDSRNRREAEAVVRRLASVFGHLSGPFHTIRGHVITDDDQLFEAIRERSCPEPTYDSLEIRFSASAPSWMSSPRVGERLLELNAIFNIYFLFLEFRSIATQHHLAGDNGDYDHLYR